MPTLVKPATTMEQASEEDPSKAEAAEDPSDVGVIPEEQARAQFLADFLVIHARYVRRLFLTLLLGRLMMLPGTIGGACLILGECRRLRKNGQRTKILDGSIVVGR